MNMQFTLREKPPSIRVRINITHPHNLEDADAEVREIKEQLIEQGYKISKVYWHSSSIAWVSARLM